MKFNVCVCREREGIDNPQTTIQHYIQINGKKRLPHYFMYVCVCVWAIPMRHNIWAWAYCVRTLKAVPSIYSGLSVIQCTIQFQVKWHELAKWDDIYTFNHIIYNGWTKSKNEIKKNDTWQNRTVRIGDMIAERK